MRRITTLICVFALLTVGCETKTNTGGSSGGGTPSKSASSGGSADQSNESAKAEESEESDETKTQAANERPAPTGDPKAPGLRGACLSSSKLTSMGFTMNSKIWTDDDGRLETVELRSVSPGKNNDLLKKYTVTKREGAKTSFEGKASKGRVQIGHLQAVEGHNVVTMNLDNGADGSVDNRGLFVYGTRPSDALLDGAAFMLAEGADVSPDQFNFTYDDKGRVTEATPKEGADVKWAKATFTYANDFFNAIALLDGENNELGGWSVKFDGNDNPTTILKQKKPGGEAETHQSFSYDCTKQ